MKCKIVGCEKECWYRGYASKYNDYCKKHGEDREKLDNHYEHIKQLKEQEKEE
jgi:hypothetical protein